MTKRFDDDCSVRIDMSLVHAANRPILCQLDGFKNENVSLCIKGIYWLVGVPTIEAAQALLSEPLVKTDWLAPHVVTCCKCGALINLSAHYRTSEEKVKRSKHFKPLWYGSNCNFVQCNQDESPSISSIERI